MQHLKVDIPDINNSREVYQCDRNSPSILTNQIELRGKMYDDTEVNPGSPSILEFGLGGETASSGKDLGNQLHVIATKRKRNSENIDNGENDEVWYKMLKQLAL